MFLNLLNNLVANWKTSILGLAAIALTVLLLMGRINHEQYLMALGVLLGGGLLAAKDSTKTGV